LARRVPLPLRDALNLYGSGVNSLLDMGKPSL
jgi:hypothetical protein